MQAFAETRYVDKHRSGAFVAGQKDLADDIKNKMKQDRRRERRTADVDTQWGIFYKVEQEAVHTRAYCTCGVQIVE